MELFTTEDNENEARHGEGERGDKEIRLEHESPCLPLSLSPCIINDCYEVDVE
jgi:hypothetical protein